MSDVGRFFGSCILLFMSCCLSASAGVGGGGLNVPILMIAFGFSFKRSVVFSDCTLMGNFISQVAVNIWKHHPASISRPVIYFDIILVLLPAQLGGSNIGSILAKILPDTILYCLALCVLLTAAALTLKKGLYQRAKELAAECRSITVESASSVSFTPSVSRSSALVTPNISIADSTGAAPGLLWNRLVGDSQARDGEQFRDTFTSPGSVELGAGRPSYEVNPILSGGSSVASSGDDNFKSVHLSNDTVESGVTKRTTMYQTTLNFPWHCIFSILFMWSIYVSLAVTMGTFNPCSVGGIATLVAIYPPLLMASLYGVYIAAQTQSSRPATVLEGDIKFSDYDLKPAAFVFLVGVLCSILGIGGGELVGPLLLSIGVLPQVSSATTSAMSFFNTLSILIHLGVQQEIDYNIGPFVFAVGLLGGFTGRTFGLWFCDKYKRPSVLIMSLVGVLVLSCIFFVFELSTSSVDMLPSNLCAS